MSGTDIAYGAAREAEDEAQRAKEKQEREVVSRYRCAMSGTDLRTRYAKAGTDLHTRYAMPGTYLRTCYASYALATPCLVPDTCVGRGQVLDTEQSRGLETYAAMLCRCCFKYDCDFHGALPSSLPPPSSLLLSLIHI
eukprot:1777885-Rhodomonas_salina.3